MALQKTGMLCLLSEERSLCLLPLSSLQSIWGIKWDSLSVSLSTVSVVSFSGTSIHSELVVGHSYRFSSAFEFFYIRAFFFYIFCMTFTSDGNNKHKNMVPRACWLSWGGQVYILAFTSKLSKENFKNYTKRCAWMYVLQKKELEYIGKSSFFFPRREPEMGDQ